MEFEGIGRFELLEKIKQIEKMFEGYSKYWSLYNGNEMKPLSELSKQVKDIILK